MLTTLNFDLSLTLVNNEGRNESVFEGVFEGVFESVFEGQMIGLAEIITRNSLTKGKFLPEWERANRMASERSDDGTQWEVEIECKSITNNHNGHTDWDDDMMPQRADVTAQLNTYFDQLVLVS